MITLRRKRSVTASDSKASYSLHYALSGGCSHRTHYPESLSFGPRFAGGKISALECSRNPTGAESELPGPEHHVLKAEAGCQSRCLIIVYAQHEEVRSPPNHTVGGGAESPSQVKLL